MPTGYTAELADGKKEVTFEHFMWGIARAFGALILMRDNPHDAPIPEKFEPSAFYTENIARDEKRLAEVQAWSVADASRKAKTAFDRASAQYVERKAEREDQRQRYEIMLAKVRAWEPPTPDHVNMKEFAIEQLTTSIKHDCDASWDKAPAQLSGRDYRAQELAAAMRNLKHSRESHAEELARTTNRNVWIAELRRSLELEVSRCH